MADIKLHILGSCSGTEPFFGRHHTSIALELPDSLYFLDAGECCSYTAHLMGIDLLKTKGIFISHSHMDHIGGLGNLLWTIRKLSIVKHRQPLAHCIHTYLPDSGAYEGILQTLKYTEGDFSCEYRHEGHGIKDGLLYRGDGEDFSIDAIHNHHLRKGKGDFYRSFSFRVKIRDWMIFYSGDTELTDLAYTLPPKCDYLFMETGHHQVKEVCEYLKTLDREIGCLVFFHHGVKVLENPKEAAREARQGWGENVRMADDGMTITIPEEERILQASSAELSDSLFPPST